MARNRRIGILTGGGDVPGLNASSSRSRIAPPSSASTSCGIRRGWEGLTHQQPGPELEARYVVPLDRVTTRTIDRTGGTWLHSSRTNPRKMKAAALPPHLDADARRADARRRGPLRHHARRAARTSRPWASTTSSPSAATTR